MIQTVKIKVRNCVLLNSKDELKSSTVVENKKGRDKPEFRELLTRAKCSLTRENIPLTNSKHIQSASFTTQPPHMRLVHTSLTNPSSSPGPTYTGSCRFAPLLSSLWAIGPGVLSVYM